MTIKAEELPKEIQARITNSGLKAWCDPENDRRQPQAVLQSAQYIRKDFWEETINEKLSSLLVSNKASAELIEELEGALRQISRMRGSPDKAQCLMEISAARQIADSALSKLDAWKGRGG